MTEKGTPYHERTEEGAGAPIPAQIFPGLAPISPQSQTFPRLLLLSIRSLQLPNFVALLAAYPLQNRDARYLLEVINNIQMPNAWPRP